MAGLQLFGVQDEMFNLLNCARSISRLVPLGFVESFLNSHPARND